MNYLDNTDDLEAEIGLENSNYISGESYIDHES